MMSGQLETDSPISKPLGFSRKNISDVDTTVNKNVVKLNKQTRVIT